MRVIPQEAWLWRWWWRWWWWRWCRCAYPKKHEYESIDDRLEESKTGADTCDCKAEQRKLPPEQINIEVNPIYRFSFQLKYIFKTQGCRKKSMYNPSIFSRSIKGLWTLCTTPNLRLKRKLRIIERTIMRWILTVSMLMMRGCAVYSLQCSAAHSNSGYCAVKSNSNSDSPTSIQLNALPFAHKVVPIGLTYLVVGTLFWKYHQPILGQVRWRTLPKNANSNQPDDKKTENKHISVTVSIPCPTSRKSKTRTKTQYR